MKKVLIADDEFLVRVGLKSTVPWEANGFIIVGDAKNGKEAIELFEEFDPDILLTDIRMPIINGLELIQELKSRKSSLKAVILTHYDDFNYAKEAIKLGASEYILKSDLSPEVLLSVLKKISDEIDSSAAGSPESKEAGRMDVMHDKAHYERIIRKIVSGDYETQEELKPMIQTIGASYKNARFVVALAEFSLSETKGTGQGDSMGPLKNSIENIIKNTFSEHYISVFSFFDENSITCVFAMEGGHEGKGPNTRLYDLVVLLKNNIKQFVDIDLTIGLSGTGDPAEQLPRLVERARAAQKDCFFEPSGIAVYKERQNVPKRECPKISLDILRGYIKVFDTENLVRYINSIFDELYALRDYDYARNIFIDFLSLAKIIATELDIKKEPALSESKFNYRNFDKLNSFEAVKKYITDLYCELTYITTDNKPDRYSFIISKCLSYIRDNYSKNITLADAADHVQISKSYLSLLFKQETGVNFSTFLTNYRIEKSKVLLKETNMKIYEIADQVGFDNPYYFSKVFKEVAGLSCKEYKKLNAESRSEPH